jgi:anti-anti-sigma regulatory factor
MNFKIDTKEKFTVIAPLNENLSDKLTEELVQIATEQLKKDIRNVVVNLKNVFSLNESAATHFIKLEQTFYENNASFVICELQPLIETELKKNELLDALNITPTESEAWDIVQMEEIERELMGNDNASEDNEE